MTKDTNKDKNKDFLPTFDQRQLEEIVNLSKTKFKNNEFLEHRPTQTKVYRKENKKKGRSPQ
jgi:hypothetical protein